MGIGALCAVAFAGVVQLRTEVGYRAFLGANHPTIRTFDAFVERYSGGLPLVAVWSCRTSAPCEHVFDPSSLAMAYDVARALEGTPGVRSVDSPATSPVLVSAFDFVPEVRRFTNDDGAPADDVDELARLARRDPLWAGMLVSRNLVTGAIVVHLDSSDSDTSRMVYARLREAVAPWEARGFSFAFVGGPVEFVVAGPELQADVARLIPIMLIVIGATLFVLFRSLAQAVITLVTVGVAVLWSTGLLGWLGWPQTSLTQVLGPLILTIGVCDGIHVLSRTAEQLRTSNAQPLAQRTDPRGRKGADPQMQKRRGVLHVCGLLAGACFMTSITTAAGMASFATSHLEAMRHFGVVAAAGVMFAYLLTFTLLPVLFSWIPAPSPRAARASTWWARRLGMLVDFGDRRAGMICVVALLLVGAASIGLGRLRLDATFEDLYGRDSKVVRWVEEVARTLRKPDTLEIELRLPAEAELAAPETLAAIERVETRIRMLDGIGASRSIASLLDYMKRRVGARDRRSDTPQMRVRRNRVLLEGMAEQNPDVYAQWVSNDAHAVRLSFTADKLPQDRLRATLAGVHRVLAGLPPGWQTTVTGPLAVVHDMIEDLKRTQLESFALAFALIFVLLTLYVRSLSWALLGMFPTVFPAWIVLGIMGLAGLPLDPGSAMVGAVVLGIMVDDPIHLLAELRRLVRDERMVASRAMRHAVERVGRAVVTTSFALALGFFALRLSSWKSVASFGAISAIAILCALLTTLLVMPALVHLTDRRGRT